MSLLVGGGRKWMMRSIWFSVELPANSALPEGRAGGGALVTEGRGTHDRGEGHS